MLFSVKCDDEDETKDEKIIILSVKELAIDYVPINNLEYKTYSKESLEIIKSSEELMSKASAVILEEKKIKLHQFNKKLKLLQDKYLTEAVHLVESLKKRVEDKNDLLDDYEVELDVRFILKEDDKEFNEDDDNIVTIIKEYITRISKEDLKENHDYYGNANHNEHIRTKIFFSKDDYNCWWFHCLYDHNIISFDDILRIGDIWADLKVRYQYFDEI